MYVVRVAVAPGLPLPLATSPVAMSGSPVTLTSKVVPAEEAHAVVPIAEEVPAKASENDVPANASENDTAFFCRSRAVQRAMIILPFVIFVIFALIILLSKPGYSGI